MLGDLWLFVIMFVFVYIPMAIAVGAWHRKTQLKVETDIHLLQSPLQAKIFKLLLDIQTGTADEKEVAQMRELLDKIEKGHGQG